MTYNCRNTDGSGSPRCMPLVASVESAQTEKRFLSLRIGQDPDEAARVAQSQREDRRDHGNVLPDDD